jgi:outer membrane protein assembly factor BamB
MLKRNATLLLLGLTLLLAACGGSGNGSGAGGEANQGGAPKEAGYLDWPLFGRVPERTQYLPARGRALDPPLKEAWNVSTHGLIEFPPAIANGVAYVINKYGNGKAVRLRDRKVLWELQIRKRNHGKPSFVTAPVYYDGRVYGAFLGGTLVAADAANGKEEWHRELHAHLESSPVAVNGALYLGTDSKGVIAVNAADGKVLWRFDAPAAIKASPSFHAGRLFVADYQSAVFALDAKTGRPLWRTNTSRVPPFGEGGFFSSPAIAFGRVYAARDDGTVYAFDERTGKVDWHFDSGGAVYGSPAVARVPGTPPTVYIGSEDGRFFALDARTGKPRWIYRLGGPVPGTAVVIGHTVYTSSFKTMETTGIDARSGKRTFQIHQAGYTPMVSDGRRLYLVGYFSLIGLEPTGR